MFRHKLKKYHWGALLLAAPGGFFLCVYFLVVYLTSRIIRIPKLNAKIPNFPQLADISGVSIVNCIR